MAEPMSPFLGLDTGDAVELGELLAFVSDWLASDPTGLTRRCTTTSRRPTTSAPPAASTNCALTLSVTLECCSAMTQPAGSWGSPGQPQKIAVGSRSTSASNSSILAAGDTRS
jgi:hypothetical protein